MPRVGWFLLLPMLVIMIVVTGFPLVNTVWLAFTDAALTGRGYDWTLDRDRELRLHLGRPEVPARPSGRRSTSPSSRSAIEVVLGVLVALLLNQEFKGRALVRALMILPWALPTIVNAMMWRLIYNPDFGALNALLVQTGLMADYRCWLGDPKTAMNMIIIADIWKNYPLIALIALGALQTIPRISTKPRPSMAPGVGCGSGRSRCRASSARSASRWCSAASRPSRSSTSSR